MYRLLSVRDSATGWSNSTLALKARVDECRRQAAGERLAGLRQLDSEACRRLNIGSESSQSQVIRSERGLL